MDFEQAPAEILMASELVADAAKYLDRSVRVLGRISAFDPANERVALMYEDKTVTISSKLLGPIACRVGDTWHFIGTVEEAVPIPLVMARIGAALKDLDLRLFFESLRVRRKCLADLEDTADAIAAAAALSQFE